MHDTKGAVVSIVDLRVIKLPVCGRCCPVRYGVWPSMDGCIRALIQAPKWKSRVKMARS